jgi:hypothetical protein
VPTLSLVKIQGSRAKYKGEEYLFDKLEAEKVRRLILGNWWFTVITF